MLNNANRQNMLHPKPSQRLVKDLRQAAERKGNEHTLSSKDARDLLDALDIDWHARVTKETKCKDALQSFILGVRNKFDSATIIQTTIEHNGREHDQLLVSTYNTNMTRTQTGTWPDNVLVDILLASGLSRYYDSWGGHDTATTRDVYFGSKRGRKPQ